MGDYYQTIVDCEVTQQDAHQVAAYLVKRLVHREIIQPTLSDCILSDKPGYAPGPRIEDVLTETDQNLRQLKVNGLEVIVGKVIGMPVEAWSGTWQLFCPNCGANNPFQDAWNNAMTEWFSEKANGMLECKDCKQAQIVTKWHYDPSWGFGNLGFTFWNWPPLKQTFIEDFREILGHRTVYFYGKI